MKKSTAIKSFGGVRQLAAALEISTQAIYQWPEELSDTLAKRVRTGQVKKRINSPK